MKMNSTQKSTENVQLWRKKWKRLRKNGSKAAVGIQYLQIA